MTEDQDLDTIIIGKSFFGKLLEKGKKLVYTTAFLAALAVPTNAQCGDCNSDGRLDIRDALVAGQHAAGIITLQSPEFEACNVEGVEGGPYTQGASVDVIDALGLARYSAGITQDLECVLNRPLVFSSNRNGNYDIFRMEQDGSNVQRLTADISDELDPDLSPDRTKIVFSSSRGGYANNQLYVMDADGSNVTVLSDFLGYEKRRAKWKPDGSQVLFDVAMTGSPASVQNPDYELFVMDAIPFATAQGVAPSIVGADQRYGDWHPSGQKIALALSLSGNSSYHVYEFDLTSGLFTQLTSGPLCWTGCYEVSNFAPNYNRDGTKIAFTKTTDPCWTCGHQDNVYVMDANGMNITPLTARVNSDQSSGWSADNQAIIFSTYNRPGSPGNWDIFRKNITTLQEDNLTQNPSQDIQAR